MSSDASSPTATITPVEAACCGALGCREDEELSEIEIPGFGARVLCPAHREELLAREVDR